jgi:excisionase family DNA binding protein
MNENLLTVDDICHELGIGKTSVYKLLKDKKIKSAKIGSRLVVKKSELKRYIDKQLS